MIGSVVTMTRRLNSHLLITCALLVCLPAVAAAQARLTAASNVRLRALASAESDLVAELPLGTELQDVAAGADGWVHVRAPDGRAGWVLERLTRAFTPGQRDSIIEAVIRERLVREGDSFQAHAELVAFIERVAPGIADPETSARFALHRLHALRGAVKAIPFVRRIWTEPLRAWVEARNAQDIWYNEPGGEWMLRSDVILAAYERHRTTSVAEELAWLLVQTGLPGECEGFIACYLNRHNAVYGEYLRRLPQGSHVDEVLAELTTNALYFVQNLSSLQLDREYDCKELPRTLAALRAAIAATRKPAGALLEAYDKFDRLCPRP